MSERLSIPEYINGLTVDQLRCAKERIEDRLKKAADSGRRVVWRVARNGWAIDENFREEDYEKACDCLMSIYKQNFMECAERALKERNALRSIIRDVPSIDAELVTQVEYDTEWFPTEPSVAG